MPAKIDVLKSSAVKLAVIGAVCLAVGGIAFLNRQGDVIRVEASAVSSASFGEDSDEARSRAAFNDAVKVFFSPRCANCHPAGDGPTQDDSMIQHNMNVKRGPDGRGVGEMKCATCHQNINLEGDNMPPGAPDWHMPPADQKMVFQGVSAGQLCRNLKDPLSNGGRQTAKDAVQHIASDPKTLWAWSPGNGRATPPLSQAEFLRKMNEWVANGAACSE